jgi:hypothetical protein
MQSGPRLTVDDGGGDVGMEEASISGCFGIGTGTVPMVRDKSCIITNYDGGTSGAGARQDFRRAGRHDAGRGEGAKKRPVATPAAKPGRSDNDAGGVWSTEMLSVSSSPPPPAPH